VGNIKSLAIVVKLIQFLKSLTFKDIVNSENTSGEENAFCNCRKVHKHAKPTFF
jgi:hypothetical protein